MKEVLGKTERVELLVSGRHEGEDSQVALAPSFIRALRTTRVLMSHLTRQQLACADRTHCVCLSCTLLSRQTCHGHHA